MRLSIGRSRCFVSLAIFSIGLILPMAAYAHSGTAGSGIQAFSEKIAAHIGPPRSVLISFENRSEVPADTFAEACQNLQDALQASVLRFVLHPPAEVKIHVTLVENTRGSLWIAQIQDGKTVSIVLEQIARASGVSVPPRATVHLRRQFLFQQGEPILDLAQQVLPGTSQTHMLILSPRQIVDYSLEAEGWVQASSTRIPHEGPWPRDLRGRVSIVSPDAFQLFLPGLFCTGQSRPAMELKCSDGKNKSWAIAPTGDQLPPVLISPGRNYFAFPSATAIADGESRPFFSAALFHFSGAVETWLSSMDGRIVNKDRNGSAPTGTEEWGSDFTKIRPSCGSAADVAIASGAGDWSQPDGLRAYQVEEGSVSPLGPRLNFPGPVTALWPSADGASVLVVVKDLQTNSYEAFSISIGCGS